MIARNLRHLRLFLAVAETGSLTRAAEVLHLSQPAVTQAIARLEQSCGAQLFLRRPGGFFLSERGTVLAARVRAGFRRLDEVLAELSPRLRLTLSHAQLQALIAVAETENFTLAARSLVLAQPTVHRAVTQAEQEAGRMLFERTSFGIVPNRICARLVQAARLMIYELDQADAELAAFEGAEIGRITIGAMPLARSALLPQALARFRQQFPRLPLRVIDGPYDMLLPGLRRGAIDFLIGALRHPAPAEDILQEHLFDDGLSFLARPGHPLLRGGTARELQAAPWVVPPQGTPARAGFEAYFRREGLEPPARIIESGSFLLMRELLREGEHLGCISTSQSAAEVSYGLLARLDVRLDDAPRAIGLTTREGWQPTRPQRLLCELVREVAEARRYSQNLWPGGGNELASGPAAPAGSGQ